MISIKHFQIEGKEKDCVTDNKAPTFSFYYESDDTSIKNAVFTLSNGYKKELTDEVFFTYDGEALSPYKTYKGTLTAYGLDGSSDKKDIVFSMGKIDDPWIGKWITDPEYTFTEKGVSPKVMTFRKKFHLDEAKEKANIYITCIGVYRLEVNGKKVSESFLKPGFTSYKNNLMYQVYDISSHLMVGDNEIVVHVAGGWAVGSFVFTRVNRVYKDKQSLLLELHMEGESKKEEIIASDDTFEVSTDGPYLMADLYDGETYDANIDTSVLNYHKVHVETIGFKPSINADDSSDIRINRIMKGEFVKKIDNKFLFDFKQNLTGIIHLKIKNGKKGNRIIIHHAEILNKEGDLDLSLLRTAKATLTYICKDGYQEYTPEFTYMGFRYITIEGIESLDDVEILAYHLTSEIKEHGHFECSNKMLNQLDSNIHWSSRNNFMDIPTDCPQRDERMGWTGDISIFANTASFNFEMHRFLKKWLRDVKAEQLKTGGIPNTVPIHGYGFPATMPKMAIDFWGDCILTVPYTLYEYYGDRKVLEELYPNMKKYVEAEKFWANLIGIGKYRYIWHTPAIFHFGDWVSPDVDKMSAWQKRSKYTATASLCRCSALLSKIAGILGYKEDEAKYRKIASKVKNAYSKVFTKDGKLKKEEFQTGYVLPLAFDMFDEKDRKNALFNLVRLIEKNDYCIGTGFPGTPYILFVLADNGYADVAYKMLLNTKAPSWLYNVSVGGTTIWEKFDGMMPDGTVRPSKDGTGNMVSFDHYASGSVGEFLYSRIVGIRILEAGYKSFEVRPILGGDITYASASTLTPHGEISVRWERKDEDFTISVKVPMSTTCKLVLPDGSTKELTHGTHTISCKLD